MGNRMSRAIIGLAAFLACLPISVAAHNLAAQQSLPDALERMERSLKIEFQAQQLPSLTIAIVYRSELVYARSFGEADQATARPASPDTRYRIGSLTKPVTATLAMMLAEDGILDLDAPVNEYLTAFDPHPAEHWAGRFEPAPITLRHLLTHTSGLPNMPPNLVPRGRDPFGGYATEQFDQILDGLTLEWPPGLYFSYSNLGYGMIGRIIEVATGADFETVLHRHLLDPLGMTGASLHRPPDELRSVGYRLTDPTLAEQDWDTGALAAAGGLYASARDLARFLALHLDEHQVAGNFLSSRSLHEMRTDHFTAPAQNFAMGLGWFHRLIPPGIDLYWHTGVLAGHFSYMAIAPDYGIGVVALTNRRRDFDPLGFWLARRAIAIFGSSNQLVEPVR